MAGSKIFIGDAKEHTFSDGGSVLNVSLCLSDIPKEHIQTSDKNGKKYLDVKIQKRREVGKFGHTHSVMVDTWRADKARESLPGGGGGDVPF